MSVDPSSSSAAPPQESDNIASVGAATTQDTLRDQRPWDNDNNEDDGDGDGQGDDGQANERSTNNRRRRKRNKRKKRNPGLKKKLQFHTHLMKSLDGLFWAELSALYYMECSFFRFFMRGFLHVVYLTPKEEDFPMVQYPSRQQLLGLLLSNMWCIMVHIFTSVPEGPDYHRGYQHGGMIIDFVGQRPPSYRIYYLLADIFIIGIQFLMMTVHSERERLRESLKLFVPLPDSSDPAPAEVSAARTIDEIDAEERTITSSGPSLGETSSHSDSIELQSIRSSSTRSQTRSTAEPEGRLGTGEDMSRSRLYDILTSGNAVIGDYHVARCLRRATNSWNLQTSAAQSVQTIGYRATMAVIAARRRRQAIQRGQDQDSGVV